ncbi:MAG: hypothetical protein V3W34_20580 [Phycisphaerae bacterium]
MGHPSLNEQVVAWLQTKIFGQVVLRVLGGVAILFLGAGVVYATFWIIYGVTWFILHRLELGSGVLLMIPGAVVILLFLGNARTDREYLEEYSVSTGTFSDEVVTFYVPGIGMASNINPLAPDTMHTGVKLITSCLYTGPRMVTAALRMFHTAGRLAFLDRTGCAAVIAFLYARRGRATYADIMRGVPTLNPVKIFPQMSSIDGVLVLSNEPAGLALSSRLSDELAKVTT